MVGVSGLTKASLCISVPPPHALCNPWVMELNVSLVITPVITPRKVLWSGALPSPDGGGAAQRPLRPETRRQVQASRKALVFPVRADLLPGTGGSLAPTRSLRGQGSPGPLDVPAL